MAAQTATMNRPKEDSAVEQKIQELRQLYVDMPQYVKTALENSIPGMISLASQADTQTESAGRIGVRQGRVSELLFIVPFAPGGAKRLRTVLRLLKGNFSAGTKVG